MLREINFILLIILLLITSVGVSAGDKLNIAGSLSTSIEAFSDDGELIDRERLNLELKRDFGFAADMYIDLAIQAMEKEDTEVGTNEAYLNYYTDNMDWRIGKQVINWGSSYKLQPTDYFNPYDYTALKPLDEKLGIKAVKGVYYTPNALEITGVVVPFFESSIANDVEDDLENLQAGFKVTRRSFKGFDLSVSGYHGFDKIPLSIQGDITFAELDKFGFDLIGDIGEMGIWTECVYGIYKDNDFDNSLAGTFGVDYKFTNDLYLVGQLYYLESRIEKESDTKMFNFHFDKPVFNFHTIEGKVIYEFESETFVFEPQFTYSLAEAIELQIGGTFVERNNEDVSIAYDLGEDRFYSRLNIEF
ncbi:hypothetical protein [Halocella sp. SP3-1]|uniref:hypothetical protein n=1 Tax=Halocella sp. SP3-1 TaxID=2382161 RepID=UPI000F7614A0|nr:hypothetical protein [Halocella sp. SP3-1]AZO95943.1 hypothetical protein D7D81_15850 [Halocella sp. SP3-1]